MFEVTTAITTDWIKIDNMYIDIMSYSAFKIIEVPYTLKDGSTFSIIGYLKNNISYQTLQTDFKTEEDAQKFLDELFNPEPEEV